VTPAQSSADIIGQRPTTPSGTSRDGRHLCAAGGARWWDALGTVDRTLRGTHLPFRPLTQWFVEFSFYLVRVSGALHVGWVDNRICHGLCRRRI